MPAAPPQTLAELRQLTTDIENRHSLIRLGGTALVTLKSMLNEPANTAVSTITSLAAAHDINPSTLTRLAQNLGYQKFSNLQKVFRDHVEGNAHFYTRRVDRLLDEAEHRAPSDSDHLFNDIVEEEIANIASLTANLNPQAAQRIILLFARARKIRFHGRRQFYSLACFYVYTLGLIRDNVGTLQNEVDGISYSLTYMDERDLLVVLGCAPYTKATADACKVAQSKNIPVIAITDSPNSPLAQFASEILLIPTESHFYSNSMAASFVMAEGLLALTARKLGAQAIENLKKREQIIEEFGITLNRYPE